METDQPTGSLVSGTESGRNPAERVGTAQDLRSRLEGTYVTPSGSTLESLLNGEGRAESAVDERLDVAQAARSYVLTGLKQSFVSEQVGDNPATYLDEQQRLPYELTIRDGLLYDANGELFDATNGQAAAIGLNAAMLVMDRDGRIFASNAYEMFMFHHSSLVAGADVAAAVMVAVHQGTITVVTDKDVRPYPSENQSMYQFLDRLDAAGVPLTPDKVYLDDPGARDRDLEEYLARRPSGAPLPAFATPEQQQVAHDRPARYGPFHRTVGLIQDPEELQQLEAMQRLDGEASAIQGTEPAVVAFAGALPEGTPGVEFYTDTAPDPGNRIPGMVQWSGGRNDTTGANGSTRIDVAVTSTRQEELETPELADDGGPDTEPKYHTKPMSPGMGTGGIKLFNEVERERYRLRVGPDGRLYDSKGRRFDTRNLADESSGYGCANFAMDAAGNIYATTEQRYGKLRIKHPSFLAGGEVAAAGTIRVIDGVVEFIANDSGHYEPTHDFTLQAVESLREKNVPLDGANLMRYREQDMETLPVPPPAPTAPRAAQQPAQPAFGPEGAAEAGTRTPPGPTGGPTAPASSQPRTQARLQGDRPGDQQRQPDAPARYGPFHRPVSQIQGAEELQQAQDTHQLEGAASGIANTEPTVFASQGPLPEGTPGVQFYTDVPPDSGNRIPGTVRWSGGRNDTSGSDGSTRIDVVVTDSRQTEAGPDTQAETFNDGGPLAEPTYPTRPMDPRRRGEHLPAGSRDGAVTYFNDAERERLRLRIGQDGKLRDATGALFDTRRSAGSSSGHGFALFVMDSAGNIYATTEQSHGPAGIRHSSMLAGAEVAAAGEISVINGVVKIISNQSGHYTPTHDFTQRMVERLRANGVPVAGVKLVRHSHGGRGTTDSYVTGQSYGDVSQTVPANSPASRVVEGLRPAPTVMPPRGIAAATRPAGPPTQPPARPAQPTQPAAA
ncbi:MAG: hypothetical protein ACRDUA_07135, partial [Micromonosporaceae bacterium]